MKKDLRNRTDIKSIVSEFYTKLMADTAVSHFFDHITQNNSLDEHLEVVTDFWNGILFDATSYQKNAMQPHLDLNKKIPFKPLHFEIWLQLFTATVDDQFVGEKAELMKTRAISIATIMQIKMKS